MLTMALMTTAMMMVTMIICRMEMMMRFWHMNMITVKNRWTGWAYDDLAVQVTVNY